jgi:selenocysteine lyase/cysteine desulfurase
VTEPEQATLVSWRVDEPEALVGRLAEQSVVVRALPGTGLVRASCGYWTSDEDLGRLIQCLEVPLSRLSSDQLGLQESADMWRN